MAGNRWATERPIKDKNGVTITLESQVERRREHFHKLLNRSAPEEPAEISAEQLLQMPLYSPTREEIKPAIFSPNNGKTTRPNRIPVRC